MLTSFVEERPVKRLKGQLDVYDDSSGNTSCKTSPEQVVFQNEEAGVLPAKTPALNLVNDSFATGGPQSGTDASLLASRQLNSLQRRFTTQQVLQTPRNFVVEENNEKDDVAENVPSGNDAEGFFIFSQPGYERVSQHIVEDVEDASTPCRSSDVLDRNDSEINLPVLESGFSAKSYGEEGDLGSQPTVKKPEEPKADEDPNSRLTPAVHSADRVQLNQAGPSYFPIFRSKKDCKIVYIIRHGESEFNAACSARGSAWEDPLLFDARLTLQGRKQALSLRNEVLKWDLPSDALWITSPLTRAIETMLHVHPDVKHGDFTCAGSTRLENVMVLPEVTERLHTSGDIGRSPADLADDFPMLDSQLRNLSETWWYSKEEKPNCPYRRLFQSHEPKDNITRRIRQFRKWIIDRPEKAFVAVGHSMFWKDFATACHNGIKQETLRNCEWKALLTMRVGTRCPHVCNRIEHIFPSKHVRTIRREHRSPRSRICALDTNALIGTGLFFAPGAAILGYAFFKGKGNVKDGLSRLLTEVSQGYFQPSVGGLNIPVAEGELSDLAGDEPLFKALYNWFIESGGVFKLSFGPKAFIVVSDPQVVKHLLKDNAFNYDKGVLAEILEPIMGKGLIPADLETWKTRRRQIVPAFHKAYLENCISMFGSCTEKVVERLDKAAENSKSVNMEEEFLNLGLDIIGIGVFNYDFGSINNQSPVIQAVYGVLKEAEHRSTFYIPYWNIPMSKYIVPRQIKFQKDIKVINECLDDLINRAKSSRRVDDIEALQARDYSKVQDASLLRFLVDMRDADLDQKQLRDDLMTMLIAGHETTAAVLTWTIYLLATHPEVQDKIVEEISGIGPKPSLEDISRVPYLRNVVAESLRLYPQPPILIRRALGDDVLPSGLNGDPNGYPIGKGADLFISVWNLHRSPYLWKDPDAFRPERFNEKHTNPEFADWEGYDPERQGSSLYPNEVASDFAFLPFGGGLRKCVGDQFALTEATVALIMILSKFSFKLATSPRDVGMATGATIHTANGLHCFVKRRNTANI